MIKQSITVCTWPENPFVINLTPGFATAPGGNVLRSASFRGSVSVVGSLIVSSSTAGGSELANSSVQASPGLDDRKAYRMPA